MYPLQDNQAYASWVESYDRLGDADRDSIRRKSAALPTGVMCSIIIPRPDLGATTLARRALESVAAQLCPSWEVLAPDGSFLDLQDSRCISLPYDSDPVRFCNAALARATGCAVVLLPPDAVLAEQAVFEFAAALTSRPELELIYGDEDDTDLRGQRSNPRFRTAWDYDLMLGRNAVGDCAAMRTSTLRDLGGWRDAPSLQLSQYDLLLRLGAALSATRIEHIASILCHRASGPAASWDAEAARFIVRRHLDEQGVRGAAVVAAPLLPACNHVIRPLPDPAPLVSLIVPTKDQAGVLARCVTGILSGTDYAPFELLIIDHDSVERATGDLLNRLGQDGRVRVLPYSGAFNFAAMNNFAVDQARGEVIVLLNNDTEVLGPGWLREMVSHAVRPGIGAVGAKLLFADGRVQHCGVVTGPDWSLIHQLRLADRFDPGPAGELALVRNVAAVTGACMAFRKSVFLEVGGLDAENFKVAFNDVDLCLRMGDYGYRVLCTPFAELIHHESISRGYDETPAKKALNALETWNLRRLWEPLLQTDPFHNQNLIFRWEDAVLAAPPRRQPPWKPRAP